MTEAKMTRTEYGWTGGACCDDKSPALIVDPATKPTGISPAWHGPLIDEDEEHISGADWVPTIYCQRYLVWMFFPTTKNVPIYFPEIVGFRKLWVVFADCYGPDGKYKEPPPPPGEWSEGSRWNMVAKLAGKSYGGVDDDAMYLVWEGLDT